MKIVETYSHLNGLEYLLVRKPNLWREIKSVIQAVAADACKTKVSQEKRTEGELFYSPIALNSAFKVLLRAHAWEESRISYWVTRSEKLIRKTLTLDADTQKAEILAAGESPIYSYNQTDFVKERAVQRRAAGSRDSCGPTGCHWHRAMSELRDE
jgi:hypothetical protein